MLVNTKLIQTELFEIFSKSQGNKFVLIVFDKLSQIQKHVIFTTSVDLILAKKNIEFEAGQNPHLYYKVLEIKGKFEDFIKQF